MEVAHDMQLQVAGYVTKDLKLVNSYDTWHGILNMYVFGKCCHPIDVVGTKNVAKQLKKITQGRVRDQEVTWFPELVDKRTVPFLPFQCTEK